MASLYVALVHYPVLNRRGEIIASAVTNLDLHDLARAARTYEIPACFVVTPLQDQQVLAAQLIAHWCEGVGKDLHPDRSEALGRLRIVDNLASVKGEIESLCGRSPLVWATTARDCGEAVSHRRARRILEESDAPVLLLLGTGWGLAPALIEEADVVLGAIRGLNGYNHLSVRCAAAILLDRLLGGE